MKTLFALSFTAALVAFSLFSFGIVAAGSVLFAAGFSAIVYFDYARLHRPLRVAPAAAVVARVQKERFGLAA